MFGFSYTLRIACSAHNSSGVRKTKRGAQRQKSSLGRKWVKNLAYLQHTAEPSGSAGAGLAKARASRTWGREESALGSQELR